MPTEGIIALWTSYSFTGPVLHAIIIIIIIIIVTIIGDEGFVLSLC
jgi:hypothetical protein